MEYVSVDRILSKLHRELRGTDLNEADVIEMIGEAMEFLQVADTSVPDVAFLNVKNFKADFPVGFQSVLQVARDNTYTTTSTAASASELVEDFVISNDPSNEPVKLNPDGSGTPLEDYDVAYYRPFANHANEYFSYGGLQGSGYYQQNFTPIRLNNHTFFGVMVCRENDQSIYQNCEDNYGIWADGTGNRQLIFSFEEGRVLLAYNRTMLDPVTCYPLVPDQISFITAINYYVKWKLSEMDVWNNRDGSVRKEQAMNAQWLKYAQQAKNWAKMPKGIDDHQDLLEQSHQLIPRHRRFHGFFGSLSREENRNFNDPDYLRQLATANGNGHNSL